ncbi:MAG: hypothetical protein ACJAT0_002598, partial [Nonlabens sp.]
MKKLFISMLAIAALTLTSCGDDDNPISGPDVSDNQISGLITESKTLTNDRIWNLQGRATVAS